MSGDSKMQLHIPQGLVQSNDKEKLYGEMKDTQNNMVSFIPKYPFSLILKC